MACCFGSPCSLSRGACRGVPPRPGCPSHGERAEESFRRMDIAPTQPPAPHIHRSRVSSTVERVRVSVRIGYNFIVILTCTFRPRATRSLTPPFLSSSILELPCSLCYGTQPTASQSIVICGYVVPVPRPAPTFPSHTTITYRPSLPFPSLPCPPFLSPDLTLSLSIGLVQARRQMLSWLLRTQHACHSLYV
ncbi:hypothetical protein OH76DRAFT_742550 [Lentinus brumalis]|uniref:Uncharacterized protein n=1 Tax=Lentinus brumalis TaxID=2498619 RepID=A0A371DSE0_9APHY|nr:hypothetical protein OH76DRAFT_742550 [Polyporus brumalis]